MKKAVFVGAFVAILSVVAGMQDTTIITNPPETFAMRVLASGLEGPWEVAWGPDQTLWITERTGRRVIRMNLSNGGRTVLVTIPAVNTTFTQDGLLGLAFHSHFLKDPGNRLVWVAFTYDDAP